MSLLKLLVLFSSLSLCFATHVLDENKLLHQRQKSDLDDWIRVQARRSWSAILANISPPSALPGIIVASLSTSKPDYFYCWTRDAAIVLKEVVSRYVETHDSHLLALIKQTISATQTIQKQSSIAASSLGEPKYYVNNGSAFTGPWGRPQNDGPGLRATVYIKFARAYLKVGGQEATEYVKRVLYDGRWPSQSVIKADLEYVSNHWRETSFDLWEEVNGSHFFTLAVIQRALKDGASFAREMGDAGAGAWYEKQAADAGAQLPSFWDSRAGYIVASRNFADDHGKKSGLDVGTILGSLHAGLAAPSEFRPQSSQMLDTYHAILDSMSSLYPLNSRYNHYVAKAIGRYPEDIYDGVGTSIANPWYIASLTMAEYIYRVGSDSPSAAKTNHSEKGQLGLSTRMIGDQYVTIVRNAVQTNGSMHEQFDRVNGRGIGARDLTWSHVAFLSMDRARRGVPEF